ncbi:MAG TPA: HAMP domain-containing sensor histidine kinase [Nitrospira sp.]
MAQQESESGGYVRASQRWASPIQVLLGTGLLAVMIFLLDVWTPPSIDVPILYVFVVLLSLWFPRFFAPLLVGAATVALTFVPPVLIWSTSFDRYILLNRLIASAALLITAVLVSARRTAEADLRMGQEELGIRVEERTAELRAFNQLLEAEIAIRRVAEQSLKESQERLTERDQVRTKFISVVSHELRTPMAAIKGFVDNMLNGVTGALNERQIDYLRRMQTSLERLTRLIAQLLDWSGLEMGRAPLLLKSVSLADLVRVVADNARAVAEPKQIRVTTGMEEGLPTILADHDKIEQVLWNLVGNAIKFSPASGTVKIECRTAPDGGVLFTVSDTGCGIAPDDIPKVFDQFSGIHAQIPSAKGAQLGLYITKNLVLMHGGRIWVESTLGEGSRFFVHLPLKPTEQPVP